MSALDALVAVLDQIHRDTIACFAGDSALQRLIGGRYDQVAVVRWLVENYHYTKSAEHHISPVLHHAMSASERRVWSSFLKDESWHWRIYRPAFAQFGLRFEELDARPPAPSTRHFIETLHAISCGGPVAYAAAMIFIEQPPLSTDVGSDPLYSSLMTHYGFSRSSIRPLWWHATENLVAGHSGLGAVVITNRRIVSRSELDMALQAATDTIHAVSAWHEGVLTGC